MESLAGCFVGSRVFFAQICCGVSLLGYQQITWLDWNRCILVKGIPDELGKSGTAGSVSLFFWKWPLLEGQAPSWPCPPCSWAPLPWGLQSGWSYFEGKWSYPPGFKWFSTRYSKTCAHQHEWLWFEVCLVLSVGHWRSDLAEVSDDIGKAQVPPWIFFPLGKVVFFSSGCPGSIPPFDSMCVCTSPGHHLPSITARPTTICHAQHPDTVLMSLSALL